MIFAFNDHQYGSVLAKIVGDCLAQDTAFAHNLPRFEPSTISSYFTVQVMGCI